MAEPAQHTPGPWRVAKVEKYRAHVHGRDGVGSLDADVFSFNPETDGRLIAAAPAMYEYIASSASAGCATAQAIIDQIHGRAAS